MIPKIEFRYSWIYDQKWKRGNNKDYPSQDTILAYIDAVEKEWLLIEKNIFEELASVTTFLWQEEIIRCYVVGRCIPFSDPLTIPVFNKGVDYFIDCLVHELIHQIFIQNDERFNIEYFIKQYPDVSKNTRIHIPVHAIHQYIFLRLFNKERLQREIDWVQRLPDYKAAWDIVLKEGHEKIIQEFVSNLK